MHSCVTQNDQDYSYEKNATTIAFPIHTIKDSKPLTY
jgi:hypothetical protein